MAPLSREARQVLLELELTSSGKTAAYNSSGGARAESQNPMPFGDTRPPHLVWRDRMIAATVEALPLLVKAARDDLNSLRRRDTTVKVVEETEDQVVARMLREGDGHDASDVAFVFGRPVSWVTKHRSQAGRDASTGLLVVDAGREQRVRSLAAAGLSEREIGRQAGLPKTTVRRIMGRAA